MTTLAEMVPDEYNRFYRSLRFVLDHEGVYSFDPKDPGGETKWGISKRYHPQLDIKNLTSEVAAEIYLNEYWKAAGCQYLDFPLCTLVFDTAVNMGVHQALAYIEKAGKDASIYIAARRQGYIDRVKATPSKQRFLGGWLNRLSDLEKYIQLA